MIVGDVRKGEKELSVKETNLAHWKLHSTILRIKTRSLKDAILNIIARRGNRSMAQ